MTQILFSTARRCINPACRISLAGYFNLRYWDSVLDDIETRVLAIRQGEKEFLLVQNELLSTPESLYVRILDGIRDLPQYSEKNILVTAVHTHTAPTPIAGTANGANPEYIDFLVKQIVDAIHEAVSKPFKEGTLQTAMTRDERFEFNRRYWMKDGSVLTNPGRFNPNIVGPEGAVDYDIPILAIRSNGKLAVVLANIVNHTDTTDGTAVSADWVGWTHRMVEKNMDGEEPMMFPLIGAAGNINHFDVYADFNQSCPAEAKRIGTGYAATIINALSSLKDIPDFQMKTVFAEVLANKAEVSQEDIDEARKVVRKYADVPDVTTSNISLTSEDLARKAPVAMKYFAQKLLAHVESDISYRFRLTGISFGNVVIASLPSEPFCEIGLDIKHRYFADKFCMVVSHGNGTGHIANAGGYVPNIWNYNRGGYETTIRSNPFERMTSEKLRLAWLKIAQEKAL